MDHRSKAADHQHQVVVAAKNERIDGKETPIVRCRIVARDYSTGPSASQLGISSPTASSEALKLFLAAIGAEGFNILGLDVSTAFLFAWLGDEKVVVSMPEGCVDQGVRSCTFASRKLFMDSDRPLCTGPDVSPGFWASCLV